MSDFAHYNPNWERVVSRLPPAVVDLPAKRPFLYLCLSTGVLLGVFIAVNYVITRAGDLPAEGYEQSFLVLGLLERIGAVGVAFMAVLAVVLVRYGSLLDPWNSLQLGEQLRWFVVFLAVLTAWPFTSYGYNYYFDQGHYADRALIAILVPLIWFRPVFIYPFLFLVFATMWQLGEPDIGSNPIINERLPVLRVLNLFAAAFLIHTVTGGRRTDRFLFLAGCLVASAYWIPAYYKIQTNWITHGHLYRMPLAAYAHGWLAFLEPSTIVAFAKSISWFDWPMRISVLVMEAGFLFFLWRRSVAVGLLAGAMVFHLGVFALYGFFFWDWILLDAAVLVLLLRDRRARKIEIFSRGQLLLSVLLIGFSGQWSSPATLAWFDTRLSYTYHLEAIGVSGKRYTLPPDFFAPYNGVLTMGYFQYLVKDHGILVGPYGVTGNRARADRMTATTTPGEIFSLEAEIGAKRYDAARAARFYEFVTRYVGNWNKQQGKGAALYALRPPPAFWSFPRGETPPRDEIIREVIVTEVTTLFDDRNLTVIRELELARLEIPGKPAR